MSEQPQSTPLRIIVLGGAGIVGSRCVEELSRCPEVGLLTIADINQKAAEKLKSQIEARRFRDPTRSALEILAVKVDGLDAYGMVATIRSHHVCASALGPFSKYESRCARAALEAGSHYCSVCDDWDAASDVFRYVDESAKRRGLTVVVGLGCSPGTSGVVASVLASRMDTATDVEISSFQPLRCSSMSEGAVRHMLSSLSGQPSVWRNGKKTAINSCSTQRNVRFPQHGEATTWNVGHVESITLPISNPSVRNIEFMQGYGFGARPLVWLARRGLFDIRLIVWMMVQFFWFFNLLLRRWPPARSNGTFRIDVFGLKNGQTAHEICCGVGDFNEHSAVSLAVGTILVGLGRVKVSGGGVFAADAAFACEDYFRGISGRGSFRLYSDVEMQFPFAPSSAASTASENVPQITSTWT